VLSVGIPKSMMVRKREAFRAGKTPGADGVRKIPWKGEPAPFWFTAGVFYWLDWIGVYSPYSVGEMQIPTGLLWTIRVLPSRARVPAPILAFLLASSLLWAGQRDDLLNPLEIHNEIRVDPAAAPAVRDFFPSFHDYQGLVMFHPTLGYYASGRVNFTQDYRTFPDASRGASGCAV
jgi:hypothetical protein